jgi:hypothetical protein
MKSHHCCVFSPPMIKIVRIFLYGAGRTYVILKPLPEIWPCLQAT